MKKFRQILSTLLIVLMVLTLSLPAFATDGAKTDPYGFVWKDDVSNQWHIQFYVFSKNENAYYVYDAVSLNGNRLVDFDGNVISNNVPTFTDAKSPTVIFDNKGNLYFISNNEVFKMTDSTDSTYSKATNINNAKSFTLDENDLGKNVAQKKLSAITFEGNYNRFDNDNNNNDNVVDKKTNYVKTYMVGNDYEKIAYDAYKDDKLILSIYCKGANVWLETEKILLSNTCTGAKFVGYTKNYAIILSDLDGTIYIFAYKHYKQALPIILGEELMSFTKDDNGFITALSTSNGDYNLNDLLTAYGYNDICWADELAYVTNTVTTSTAYNSQDQKLGILEKNNNSVYWNEQKLSNSNRATYIGFTQLGSIVWIDRNGNLYTLYAGESQLISKDVTLLRYDVSGFAVEYRKNNKTYILNF